jgi:glycosyltransferase involved in cell wall biosynthesis
VTDPGVLLYDYLLVRGGAERVTLALAHGLDNCTLCVAGRDRSVVPDTDLQGLPRIELGGSLRGGAVLRALQALHTFRTKTRFLQHYAWVLYSGVYAPVAVHNHPLGCNVLYCHTPPRFVYDLHDYYRDQLHPLLRPAFLGLVHRVRRRYAAAVAKMDQVVANSRNVQQRLRRYLARESVVVYPPCDVAGFRWVGQEGYYVSLGRLESYKRVDRVIEAFQRMPDKRLVVTSGGSLLEKLRSQAQGAANIHFTGWLDDRGLQRVVGNAIATVYIPKDEDFGMSLVESMAAGKPVIGVAEGGVLETVIHGKTGLLLEPEPTPEAIIEAVHLLDPHGAAQMREHCELRARLFRKELFIEKMREVLRLC